MQLKIPCKRKKTSYSTSRCTQIEFLRDRNMSNDSTLEVEGIAVEKLPNATFRVKLDDPNYRDHVVLATLSGKMRMNNIKIIPGDRVKLEISMYDLTKGRIVYRYK